MVRFSGSRLRQLRRGSGLQVYDIAYWLRCRPGTVYDWEQGRANPTLDHLGQLAAMLGVLVDDLFEGVPEYAAAQVSETYASAGVAEAVR